MLWLCPAASSQVPDYCHGVANVYHCWEPDARKPRPPPPDALEPISTPGADLLPLAPVLSFGRSSAVFSTRPQTGTVVLSNGFIYSSGAVGDLIPSNRLGGDIIRGRVQRAGGQVNADLRISLAWSNTDDLDLHLVEPSGHEIYYAQPLSSHDGILDVDMNAGCVRSTAPVENISYAYRDQMERGIYLIAVASYTQRDQEHTGFAIELAIWGKPSTVTHYAGLRDGELRIVAAVLYDGATFARVPIPPSASVSAFTTPNGAPDERAFLIAHGYAAGGIYFSCP
jgi:hypothetical protein